MQLSTVRQILDVLKGFKENYSKGLSLKRSYQMSVQRVADSERVTYQTIGDACRRRLWLNDINELYELLNKWMAGDPTGLLNKIKDNTDESNYSEIDAFFNEGRPFLNGSTAPSNGNDANTQIFSFRLLDKDARMLKALAEIEGASVSEFLGEFVSESVKSKMKTFAQRIIQEK